jgi:hypothetical protein
MKQHAAILQFATKQLGERAKPCIVLIISEDLAFWTKSWPHFLGLKSDKMVSNQKIKVSGILAS